MVWEMDENDTLTEDDVETIFNNHLEFEEGARIYENFPSISNLFVAGVRESKDEDLEPHTTQPAELDRQQAQSYGPGDYSH